MCGIVGKVDFHGPVDNFVVEEMCARLVHRGPDDQGMFAEPGVGLAMRRLAIIDVAGGQQPLYNEDESIVALANGEIYNFAELRSELLAAGHSFRSDTDTEVLVHLYEEEGARLVDRLRGMFAFAIWDRQKRRLLIGRDRVGKKPLYWAARGSRFWFGSEVRALLADSEIDRAVNPVAIDAYLAFQHVPHHLGAFSAIHKLPPASVMSVTAEGVESHRYWELDYSDTLSAVSVPELAEQLRDHLTDATRVRLVSEVPLGAFLSGGIDSSAVVATMATQMADPVRTFSIGFTTEEYSELHYARRIAKQFDTQHEEFVVRPDALRLMPRMARHYGEPFADPSAIPTFYLAEMTGKHVTVALNGDGGDESFAGYRRYRTQLALERMARMPKLVRHGLSRAALLVGGSPNARDARSRVTRSLQSIALEPEDRYAAWMPASGFMREARTRLYSSEFASDLKGMSAEAELAVKIKASSAPTSLTRMLDTDATTYLPDDLLVKTDIATMAHSVEARSPFLDHNFMEFAASLPDNMKLQQGTGKWLLKEAMKDILPAECLSRSKMGFEVPLRQWFREELRDLPGEVLLDPHTLDRGYFSRPEVERLVDEHRSGDTDHALRLWTLLQLETWHRECVDVSPSA